MYFIFIWVIHLVGITVDLIARYQGHMMPSVNVIL